MSRRIEKVNKLIQKTLGDIIQNEADRPLDVLITISRVDTAPNLKSGTVWLYIMPLERGEETLEMLKGQMYDIQGALNRALQMRPLPRITLRLDLGSEHAQRVNEKLEQLEQSED